MSGSEPDALPLGYETIKFLQDYFIINPYFLETIIKLINKLLRNIIIHDFYSSGYYAI